MVNTEFRERDEGPRHLWVYLSADRIGKMVKDSAYS